ncbi:Asparagine synthetase domain-containing protein 1 [Irineochytrium annulatum]|nr:Asparagine synthetase domain-containing protein 1 [Irineochytrium annulatum]
MVLASLAARALPLGTPVDLLNVAFENPRVLSAAADRQGGGSRKRGRRRGGDTAEADAFDTVGGSGPTPPSKKSIYDVPDRITGRKGFEELCVLHRGVKWQFVEVNVGVDEAMAGKSRVMGLVKPLDTVMDLSIALAFWYASRGIGTVVKDGVRHPYVSRAKVLLSGLGADEQLGGYNRHRTSFERNSWRGLLDELQLDVSRISSRNLGRDDRIISDHGKEVRFPYLAEPVVSYLSSVPVHIKVDPRYPRGHGEKLLLRRLAYRIGLPRAAGEWKRAVQFGARTAKMMDIREKGADKLDD